MQIYKMECPASKIKAAILIGFTFLETLDEIVGFIFARPEVVQKIIYAFDEEFRCDYIPRGIGMLRTAYVFYKPIRYGQIKMQNREETVELHIKLI